MNIEIPVNFCPGCGLELRPITNPFSDMLRDTELSVRRFGFPKTVVKYDFLETHLREAVDVHLDPEAIAETTIKFKDLAQIVTP